MSRLISLSTNNGAFLYSLYQHATMYTKEKTVVFMHANEKKKKNLIFLEILNRLEGHRQPYMIHE